MASPAEDRGFLERIRDDIANRRIDAGLRRLESNRAALEALEPGQKNAGLLLGYLAQWVDIGYADLALVQSLLSRFPKAARVELPLIDYLHVRMAEGLVAMHAEEFESALHHFEFVGGLEHEIGDRELLAISNFWTGRCLRQEGRYEDALSYTVRARDLALEAGFPKMAAIMRVLESWLIFQKGKLKDAARILQEAEAALSDTDDYITRGNIHSAYGRIARREGRYDRALEHFERAIEEYKKRDARHRNLARSLVNIAFVKRLIAVQLQKRLDREAALRKAGHGGEEASARTAHDRARFAQLRSEAFAELDEAWAIYSGHHNHRGMGNVHINRGFLYLDSGELDRAGCEAAEAFRVAEEKHDYILMARGRILQCIAENTKFEEQIEEFADPNYHARLASDYAKDAVDFARHTQNPRLLARAYIWQGLTFTNGPFEKTEAARQCCDTAMGLLKPEGQGEVWEDLQELKSRILQKGRVDTILREWSQGLVGDKTFQQITEEFAGLIIPKVWEKEGRKISRVAATLSISPKKVRRVLQSAGLLGRTKE